MPSDLDDFSSLTIPKPLAKYEIRGVVGEGGMGVVYRAADRLTCSVVALKRVTTPAEQLVFASRGGDGDLSLALAQEFSAILGFIEQLNEVDVDGVEPMTSVTPQRLKRRDDVVTDGNQQKAILANAPDAREGFFAVPKVVE